MKFPGFKEKLVLFRSIEMRPVVASRFFSRLQHDPVSSDEVPALRFVIPLNDIPALCCFFRRQPGVRDLQ